ncbi:hypothetical protein GIB67_018875 [Kingdonia uniflora]|uniref:YDG domain-containing protein n=1 Tax=Kingdonia uniflora TaxID=39325 RepID=A0A7J7MYU5_9MAGN|nr:hypothetical protein GIB67_018875 [Kingdonia uniflora]
MVSTRDRLKQTKEKLVSLLTIYRKRNSKKDNLEMDNSNDRLTNLETIISDLTATVGELVEKLHITNLAKASTSVKRRGRSQRRGRSRKKGVMEVDRDNDIAKIDNDSRQSDYGAQSVALSGGYEEDEDHGEWFLYTGSDDHGDCPRPLPLIKELKKATDITNRKDTPSWDYEAVVRIIPEISGEIQRNTEKWEAFSKQQVLLRHHYRSLDEAKGGFQTWADRYDDLRFAQAATLPNPIDDDLEDGIEDDLVMEENQLEE